MKQLSLFVLALTAVSGQATVDLKTCPKFQPAYDSCSKLGGQLPKFFFSAAVRRDGQTFVFRTKTSHGEMITRYTPDRVVRLGRDHHLQDDGSMLRDLPSHESSYCEDGVLHISEITFLPDGTVAREQASMKIDEQHGLKFTVTVDGKDLLQAICAPTS